MRGRSRTVGILQCAALLLSGCASMPPVTTSYLFPKARTLLAVTQTVGCDKAQTQLVSAANVTATTAYSGDLARSATIRYSDFGGFAADADVGLTLTPDGRLAGINASTTGQGSVIISGIVSVATAAATVAMAGLVDPAKVQLQQAVKAECAAIATFAAAQAGDATKPVTLTYSAAFSYDVSRRLFVVGAGDNAAPYAAGARDTITLLPDPASKDLYARLSLVRAHPFVLGFASTQPLSARAPAIWDGHPDWSATDKAPSGFALLKLNKISRELLAVNGPSATFETDGRVWTGSVDVPQDAYYSLPIPSGTAFGKQGFVLSLGDAGGITKIEYSANSGTSDALGATVSAIKAAPLETDQLNAQSNLIHAQQRLVICRNMPASCPAS